MAKLSYIITRPSTDVEFYRKKNLKGKIGTFWEDWKNRNPKSTYTESVSADGLTLTIEHSFLSAADLLKFQLETYNLFSEDWNLHKNYNKKHNHSYTVQYDL